MNILESAITKLGNKIELIGQSGEGKVLVIGVFHGDEPQGKYLIEKYLSLPPLPNPPPRGGREQPVYKNSNYIKNRAKTLRHDTTDAEKVLWSVLRANNLLGLHFKRQQPIYKYIVDFVCFSQNLIIELDGSQHFKQIGYDNERTKFLEQQGFKVIRIWNNDVFTNLEGVVEYIISSLPPVWGRVRERGNNLLFIPCLNPDGMGENKRTNANEVDLNRNFPTKNFGQDGSSAGENPSDYYGGNKPASEIETKFLIDIIEKYKPKLILTLHAPYKIVNYDGPAKEIAQKISDIIGYPVEESIGYPTPGSFGTYCGVERNIPIITLELDEEIPVEQLEQPVFEIFDELSLINFS